MTTPAAGRKRRHGRKCRLYYNTGTHDTPTWTLISKVGDVSTKISKALAESLDRSSEFAADIPGHKKLGVSIKYMKRIGDDAVFTALMDSLYNDTTLDLAIADGDITASGTYYTRGPFVVSEAEDSQPIANGVEWPITLAPVFEDDLTFTQQMVP